MYTILSLTQVLHHTNGNRARDLLEPPRGELREVVVARAARSCRAVAAVAAREAAAVDDEGAQRGEVARDRAACATAVDDRERAQLRVAAEVEVHERVAQQEEADRHLGARVEQDADGGVGTSSGGATKRPHRWPEKRGGGSDTTPAAAKYRGRSTRGARPNARRQRAVSVRDARTSDDNGEMAQRVRRSGRRTTRTE